MLGAPGHPRPATEMPSSPRTRKTPDRCAGDPRRGTFSIKACAASMRSMGLCASPPARPAKRPCFNRDRQRLEMMAVEITAEILAQRLPRWQLADAALSCRFLPRRSCADELTVLYWLDRPIRLSHVCLGSAGRSSANHHNTAWVSSSALFFTECYRRSRIPHRSAARRTPGPQRAFL